MDDGVELKQLTVGVDSVGLGVGAGLASAIVLMAISAASVVIVFIIYCLSIVGGRLVMIAGQPLWQSKRNLLWGLGGYFSPSSPRTAAGSSRKKLVLPLLAGLLKARLKPSSYFRELRSAVSVETRKGLGRRISSRAIFMLGRASGNREEMIRLLEHIVRYAFLLDWRYHHSWRDHRIRFQ